MNSNESQTINLQYSKPKKSNLSFVNHLEKVWKSMNLKLQGWPDKLGLISNPHNF